MKKDKKHDIQIISYLARKLDLDIRELKEPVLSDYGMFPKAKAILYLANRRAIAIDALKLIKEDFYVIGTNLYLQVFEDLKELDDREDLLSEEEKLEIDFILKAYPDNNSLYIGLNNSQELRKFYITPENILRDIKDWTKKEKLNWLIDTATFELEDMEIFNKL